MAPAKVVVIGPSTARVAEQVGLMPSRIAHPHSTEGVVKAVQALIAER